MSLRSRIGDQYLKQFATDVISRPYRFEKGAFDFGASNMVILTKDHGHAVAVLMNIDGTVKTDTFRSSAIEDLLVGADLAT
ncbi:hypothetical protein FJ936_29665 [Mesorhizobium sp. B2-4-13]|uniref:hypothetical protein n=1 Tax=Mesorhizobium sp. B2-4-13 TaxID=2589936 RepID=UPI001150DC5C|nr:hypothetical protein [Mesorhizobium sp. B2-4-13]TPK80029.1 hypothetical protein FJ936_29665 [Mesorhizobium sp. B2-4-13]